MTFLCDLNSHVQAPLPLRYLRSGGTIAEHCLWEGFHCKTMVVHRLSSRTYGGCAYPEAYLQAGANLPSNDAWVVGHPSAAILMHTLWSLGNLW